MEKQEEELQDPENRSYEISTTAYSLFLYGVRSPVTRDYYLISID